MSRRAWWIGGAVFLVVLPVSVISAAVVLLDPNDYKSAITEAVYDATGRTLTLLEPQNKIGANAARRARRGEPSERVTEHQAIARRNQKRTAPGDAV